MAEYGASTWQDGLARSVKQQPRKAAALAGLVLLLLVLWAKVAMQPGGPAPAEASTANSPVAGVAAPLAPAMPSASDAKFQVWCKGPITPLTRDVFAVRLDYFRPDGSPAAAATRVRSETDGFWDELAKSMLARADQEKEKRAFVENLRRQASELRLQSTMMSNGQPRAMVNGNLVGEGDVVASFRVVKIDARGIVIEREGIKLEVLFK